MNKENLKEVNVREVEVNFMTYHEKTPLFTLVGKAVAAFVLPEQNTILTIDGTDYHVVELVREYTKPEYSTFSGSTGINVKINILLNKE